MAEEEEKAAARGPRAAGAAARSAWLAAESRAPAAKRRIVPGWPLRVGRRRRLLPPLPRLPFMSLKFELARDGEGKKQQPGS